MCLWGGPGDCVEPGPVPTRSRTGPAARGRTATPSLRRVRAVRLLVHQLPEQRRRPFPDRRRTAGAAARADAERQVDGRMPLAVAAVDLRAALGQVADDVVGDLGGEVHGGLAVVVEGVDVDAVLDEHL